MVKIYRKREYSSFDHFFRNTQSQEIKYYVMLKTNVGTKELGVQHSTCCDDKKISKELFYAYNIEVDNCER